MLSDINTSIGLADGYWVALWNETNYAWDAYISGFEFGDKYVHQWDVVQTKVSTTKEWVT
jgi:hypothetical protein